MARKRQIDPIFPQDSEISSLSIAARYFYILSWCHMSDPNDNPKKKHVGGVLPYDLQYLKKSVFPEENIDIAPIVKELLDRRRYLPFETQGKQWLWCPTLAEHQVVNHPSSTNYPEPPVALQEDYRSGKLALTQSRVELSRVELRKNQPYWAAFTKETQDKILAVSKRFNIYQLLGRIKKTKKAEIPEEVIARICTGYLKNPEQPRATWPWFIVAINKEWSSWSAEKNIREGEAIKREGVAPAIKELLAQILKGKDINVK